MPAVETLLSKGRYVSSGPLRCCWRVRDDGYNLNRILVSVPKKSFRRAVRRNLLKRRIREAYRLQKETLAAGGVDMMFYYSSREETDFAAIFRAVGDILGILDGKLHS